MIELPKPIDLALAQAQQPEECKRILDEAHPIALRLMDNLNQEILQSPFNPRWYQSVKTSDIRAIPVLFAAFSAVEKHFQSSSNYSAEVQWKISHWGTGPSDMSLKDIEFSIAITSTRSILMPELEG